MSARAVAVRRHAEVVAADRLRRAGRFLDTLEPGRRREVEQLARAVAAGVAECLLKDAGESAAVAAALDGIYGERPGPVVRQTVAGLTRR